MKKPLKKGRRERETDAAKVDVFRWIFEPKNQTKAAETRARGAGSLFEQLPVIAF